MNLFADYGRKGGLKRSRSLSRLERTLIAKKAAMARWGKYSPARVGIMPSVRLDQSSLSHPVFMEELLMDGSLDDWKKLYCELINHPFGPVALSLEKVLSSTKIYGVTPLWKGILKMTQGDF